MREALWLSVIRNCRDSLPPERIFFAELEISKPEKAIRRVISVMDKIEELSDYEKSDYLGTLASIGRGAALHDLAPLPPYL
jgi:hypothetical protein